MSGSSRRRWLLAAGLALSGLALIALGGAPAVNNSLSVWFVEDDPARLAHERFQDLFGNDEVVVLSVGTAGKPLTDTELESLSAVAAAMGRIDGIASVEGPADGAGPLADSLLSDDGSVALAVARFEVMADADARRHDILLELRRAAEPLRQEGLELHWAGIGLVYDELNQASFRETPILTAASFVIVGIALFAFAGSVGPVLVTLTSVIVSITILMGVFALAGFQLNMVTAILPTLMLVVGTATAVHIFNRLASVRVGETPDEALGDVFRPCLFTALTTAAGFASLATARMAVIRDLGLFAALGVLITFVTCFAFVRAFAATRRFGARQSRPRRTGRVFEWIAHVAVTHPWRILGSAAAVTALAVLAAAGVVVDTYSIEFFRPKHPVRVDSEAIETGYGWYLPLEFVAYASSPGAPLDADLLESVAAWQAGVERAGLAQWSLSAADLVGYADVHAQADRVGAGLIDREESALRVTFGVPMASARAWGGRIDAIRRIAEDEATGVEISAGGYLPLYVRMMEYIVDTQVRSFAAALVLVFAVMGVFLRSVRAVLIAFFPNVLPIVLVFGVMGVAGIRLDIATVTVAAIAMGIVVDDTVHLLFHFDRELARTGDTGRAVRNALVDVGPALLGTTVILAASFAVLGFASVLSIAHFGLLSAITLTFALVADLFVLPALLVATGRTVGAAPATGGH